MDDDLWSSLISAAMTAAPCGTRDCHVGFVPRSGYVLLQHLDSVGHSCAWCSDQRYPSHVVSLRTVQITQRGVLVERLSRWLGHLHANAALESGAAVVASASLDGLLETADALTSCAAAGAAS